MARKFILIDQSLAGIAGHHYEYAVHVLRAAQQAGYDTCLASNTSFARSPQKSEWKTYPIYRQGFWASEGAPRFGLLAALIAIVSWIRFRWKFAYQFSLPGVLWMHRDNLTEFIGSQMLRRGSPAELVPLVALAALLKILRLAAVLLLFPVAFAVFVWRFGQRLVRFGRFPDSYLHNLTADFRDAARFAHKMFTQRLVWMKLIQRRRHRNAFRDDTARLLAALDPAPGDIIFVPTLSPTELAGLAELIESNPAAARPAWRLLFRRNVYLGRECDYSHQHTRVSELQQELQSAAPRLHRADVRFYTDTEELTVQYNRLNVFHFETVPIPHTHAPAATRSAASTLRILYTGDARAEKGYHLLPAIIQNLWRRWVEPGRISFHLQSNYNIPQGEPKAVIARQQLEHLAGKNPSAVELLKEPLTSDQYRDLLLSGDINLLLYDAANYYARSSGILVESLSAGMPVIVPAGTWLSRQFDHHASAWRDRLTTSMTTVKAAELGDLDWSVPTEPSRDPIIHGELAASPKHPAVSTIKVPATASHLVLHVTLAPGSADALFTADPTSPNGTAVECGPPRLVESSSSASSAPAAFTIAYALHPHADRLTLRVTSNRPGLTALVSRLDLVFLSHPAHTAPPPLSSIGAVYHDESEIPALIEEVIENYGHYAESARQFSRSWRDYHNAAHLIRTLEAAPLPVAAEAAV